MGSREHPSRVKRTELCSLTLGVPAAMASFRMEFLLPREKRRGSEPRNCCGGQCGELKQQSTELPIPGATGDSLSWLGRAQNGGQCQPSLQEKMLQGAEPKNGATQTQVLLLV